MTEKDQNTYDSIMSWVDSTFGSSVHMEIDENNQLVMWVEGIERNDASS